MRLRFSENRIEYWAKRYVAKQGVKEEDAFLRLRDRILEKRVLTKQQLLRVTHWKSPRRAEEAENNKDEYVRAITGFALQTTNERARIEVLTVLSGVKWATASVILHFFHADKYPVLDFRALWSVCAKVPSRYTFAFWQEYYAFCRIIAGRNGHSMRTLDRALWQYSKEHQP